MLKTVIVACVGFMIIGVKAAQNTSLTNDTEQNATSTNDVDDDMFRCFFNTECLKQVTPVGGQDPLEDSKQFFHEHLGDLRVDSTIASMLAFAALMSLTLSGELPKPDDTLKAIVFCVWIACQLIQCILLLFAIFFAVAAYFSLHKHYGACLVDWREDTPAALHMVAFFTTGFQPAVVQRLCALQLALVALVGATKEEAPRLHSVCRVLQYGFGFLTAMSLGFSVICWLASGAFIFSALFLPTLLAALVCSSLGLLLMDFCQGRLKLWFQRQWARYKGLEEPSEEAGDTWIADGVPSWLSSAVSRACPRIVGCCMPCLKAETEQDESTSNANTSRVDTRTRCGRFRAAVSNFARAAVGLASEPGSLAYACLFWMALSPMVILGTWVAGSIYVSGEVPELDKIYAYIFEVFMGDFEWPSFFDLMALRKIPSIVDYFAELQDLMGEPPTYLLTGSRVISLMSFAFAFLKKGTTMVLNAVERFTAREKGPHIKIQGGAKKIQRDHEVEALRREIKNLNSPEDQELLRQKVSLLKEKGVEPETFLSDGVDANVLKDVGFDCQSLADAGYSLPSLHQAGFDAKTLISVGKWSLGDVRDEFGLELSDLLKLGRGVVTIPRLAGAGYSHIDLRRAGVADKEIISAHQSDNSVFEAFTDPPVVEPPPGVAEDRDTMKFGYSVKDLRAAGYKNLGMYRFPHNQQYSLKYLQHCGFSFKEIMDYGSRGGDHTSSHWSRIMRREGYHAKDLLPYYSVDDLVRCADTSRKELLEAGVSARDLDALGINRPCTNGYYMNTGLTMWFWGVNWDGSPAALDEHGRPKPVLTDPEEIKRREREEKERERRANSTDDDE